MGVGEAALQTCTKLLPLGSDPWWLGCSECCPSPASLLHSYWFRASAQVSQELSWVRHLRARVRGVEVVVGCRDKVPKNNQELQRRICPFVSSLDRTVFECWVIKKKVRKVYGQQESSELA